VYSSIISLSKDLNDLLGTSSGKRFDVSYKDWGERGHGFRVDRK